ncbi:SdpI family protein [Mycoplasmopsis fermentans]|nr:SdpI family protein [Mycoplasmopsis fermentans]ADN68969.1 hypothetical membrane spanning protein [Mycoplasmopsis fermentans JER]ADV34409.1 Conserved Hypothetical Protein [Mycoplasmopsis fermentans M64]VEU64171.1 Uncharacterised protein [Mycoplasmopsis fermentans]VEU67573.1 Uncharacterised protein [Mesomycoplasma conjunctivae]
MKEMQIISYVLLSITLLLAIIGTIFGTNFYWKTPKLNKVFSYRTKLSLKNHEYFYYANHTFGRGLFSQSIVILILSFISCSIVFSLKDYHYLFIIIFAIWFLSFFSIIIYIELKLKKRDKIITDL